MKPAELDYELPSELIAQQPLLERDSSRMLLLKRAEARWDDREFREFPDLLHGDELLVVNNARVIPARLFGFRRGLHSQQPGCRNPARHQFLTTQIEVLLTRQLSPDVWEVLVRPGRSGQPVGHRSSRKI